MFTTLLPGRQPGTATPLRARRLLPPFSRAGAAPALAPLARPRTVLATLTCALLCATAPVHARALAGVEVPETLQRAGTTLHCNGAGLRTRLFFKVYVAALYTAAPLDAAAPLPGPARLRLTLLRDLDRDSLPEALHDGLARVLDAPARAALATPLHAFEGILDGMLALHRGQQVDLDFDTGGVALSLDGQPRGAVADARLARALLAIWLGETPVDAELKTALLGH